MMRAELSKDARQWRQNIYTYDILLNLWITNELDNYREHCDNRAVLYLLGAMDRQRNAAWWYHVQQRIYRSKNALRDSLIDEAVPEETLTNLLMEEKVKEEDRFEYVIFSPKCV